MHESDLLWWEYCREKYTARFVGGPAVLEVGSLNLNGSIRQFFTARSYLGIDWRPGRDVDRVVFAHEFESSERFDVIASASMLEHDQYWPLSLRNMVEHLEESGALFLTWGSALCEPHCFEAADDGKFHALPAGRVLDLLRDLGIYVHEFRYQSKQFPAAKIQAFMGFVSLVGFTAQRYSVGPAHYDLLIPEDRG